MYITLKEGKMYYKITGQGVPVIFLHGWGEDSSTFDEINIEGIQKIAVDFLGFGKSDDPIHPLYTIDYLYHIYTLVNELNIKDPIILGHSFGGRIAIKYASYFNNQKTILVSSAGIKRHNFGYYKKIYSYKVKKRFYFIFNKKKYNYLIKNSGSYDYKKAKPVMKDTLKNVVKEDLRGFLPRIRNKTIIFWGTEDKETPYSDALLMNSLIKDSVLVPFYESGHFSFKTEKEKFSRILEGFIND